MLPRFLIYGLINPRNGQLRYVGKSSSGTARPRQHWRPGNLSKDPNQHKVRWLRQLLAAGLKPEVEVLETCDSAEALSEAEQHHIAYWRMVGCNLVNIAEGGAGGATKWGPMSEATKARISAGNKGKLKGFKRPVEVCQKISASKKGRQAPWVLRRGRPVMDEVGRMYASVQEAARELRLDVRSVSRAARNAVRGWTAGGHTFEFVEASCS